MRPTPRWCSPSRLLLLLTSMRVKISALSSQYKAIFSPHSSRKPSALGHQGCYYYKNKCLLITSSNVESLFKTYKKIPTKYTKY